ncbi:hypothetical protein ACVWW2_008445 [Bradyrhizobium sp. LM4.3]
MTVHCASVWRAISNAPSPAGVAASKIEDHGPDIKSSANRRLAFDAKAVAINLPEASGRIRAQRTRPLLHHRQTPDRAEALDYAKKASALPIEIDPIAVDRFTPVVRKSV